MKSTLILLLTILLVSPESHEKKAQAYLAEEKEMLE